MIEITVAICTWNRCKLLEQTLERMAAALVVPADLAWELVVVDNGSTDATAEVIDRFRARLPIRSTI
jgi:glucosyl-dolichyl phosphate glucuronosyltransferase